MPLITSASVENSVFCLETVFQMGSSIPTFFCQLSEFSEITEVEHRCVLLFCLRVWYHALRQSNVSDFLVHFSSSIYWSPAVLSTRKWKHLSFQNFMQKTLTCEQAAKKQLGSPFFLSKMRLTSSRASWRKFENFTRMQRNLDPRGLSGRFTDGFNYEKVIEVVWLRNFMVNQCNFNDFFVEKL